ncbi:MAG: tetratricopeptide repeat protein [Gemmatimonadetes bacterium]|nr:tetratricopeptide repeat protein [Gemmatimonadota bacterium]MYG83944.1 tetratricopeptide repeat protein [Gemmatimonadota bacterium]MYJ91132.1 tetratricopeptide repeat protein [Gemmatimonadota bacterium]
MSDLPDFDKLWDYNDPAKTEKAFRGLLPIAERAGDHDYHAQLLSQIARTHSLRRQFDEAHRILNDAKTLIVNIDNPSNGVTQTARIRLLLERGRIFNSAGDTDSARPLFKEAWELARKAGEDNHAVDAAHMLGICEPADASLMWNNKAMEAAEASDGPRARGWLGALYNNTGWTYHDAGEYEKALELFEKGLAWCTERDNPQATRIAKWTVGRAKRSLGRTEEALAIHQCLLEEHEAAGTSDGYVFEEIAECLFALGRPDEARPHFGRAYQELSKDGWLVENEPERMDRLKRLGSEQ